MKHFISRFIKFGVVGALGTIIDFAVTALLMHMFGLKEYLVMTFDQIFESGVDNIVYVVLIVNAIGFVVAATSNYYMNRIWTWRSKNPNVSAEYGKFLFVSIIGLTINILAIYLFNINIVNGYELMGIYIGSFWLSKVAATIVVMFWNFFANNYFTFRGFQDTATLDDFLDDDAQDED